MSSANITIPSNTDLLTARNAALAAGMSLYTNGKRTVISPCRPAGTWAKIGVKVIDRHKARIEVQP